jgi:SLT domain-containing protein
MASGIILEFNGIITFLTGVFTADWQRAWEGIKMMFEGVWNSMKAVVRGVLNTIIDGINNIFRGINNVAGQVGDKIGLHINIPLIPKASFAEGGTVKAPTMAMIGEAGDVETVIPHKDSLRSRQLLNAAIEGVLGKKKAEEIATMIDEVEGIAAKASKSSTSAIRAFAEGGTVTSPTLAVVGEGGSPETIIPHNGSAKSRSLLDTASRAVLGRGISAAPSGSRSDNRTYNITFSPVIQGAGLADYGLQEAFEEFKRNVTAYLDERDREAFA